METNKIRIQIHDWDILGNYRIIRNDEVTKEELRSLRKTARESVNLNWNTLDERLHHIIYYAEKLNNKREVCLAAIYMHGEAHTEESFEKITRQTDMGYVGAFHRMI